MAVMLALPLGVIAQSGMLNRGSVDKQFENGGESMFNRSESVSGNISNQGFGGTESGITNQTFGETPLGGGLFILLAAGAGYAAMKGKKRNKKSNS